jgi:hypothetical protein
MVDMCTRLQPQGSLAALLDSQQGAQEGAGSPDGYGLASEEQAAAQKTALKSQLAALMQVGGIKYRCQCARR